jgi:vacuolar-type H+-ATPase subunit C/Vma6
MIDERQMHKIIMKFDHKNIKFVCSGKTLSIEQIYTEPD